MNLTHSLVINSTLELILTSEFTEFSSLELVANADVFTLSDGIDEVLIGSFIAVISKENKLSLTLFNGLNNLSVSRY